MVSTPPAVVDLNDRRVQITHLQPEGDHSRGHPTVFSSTGAIGKPGEGPTGRAELTKYWDYYYGDKGPLSRVFQTSLDQHIEVDGDTATQESNQIIVFEFRGRPPVFGISRRKNHLVRTPEGWRIKKTTDDGGFTVNTNLLMGRLNDIEPFEPREEWKRNPDDPTGHEFNQAE
jgi:hypothetical protein